MLQVLCSYFKYNTFRVWFFVILDLSCAGTKTRLVNYIFVVF